MEKQIIEYQVHVDNAAKDGHPIQIIEYVESVAVIAFDGLAEQFPHENVRLFRVIKEEVVVRKAKPKPEAPLVCPFGHTGEQDGKPVVFRNSNGFVNCRVCGFISLE